MKYFVLLALSSMLFLPLSKAQADYYVWRDVQSGMSLTYPDHWQVSHNQQPDDVLTLKAPSGRAHASCRVRVRDDGRYTFYPASYSPAIQRYDFGADYVENYFRGYKNAEILMAREDAGLGRDFSSFGEARYSDAVPGPEMRRRAIMFVSNHFDTNYIFECSSHEDAFDVWKPRFLSIAKSIDFAPVYAPVPTGYYRPDFLGEPPHIAFPAAQGDAVIVY